MKKQIAMSLLVFLSAQFTFAATGFESGSTEVKTSATTNYPSSSPISLIAPQLGIISSKIDGQNVGSTEAKSGLAAGVSLDLGHSNLVLETGLSYRQEGAKSDGGEVKISLDYVAVPVAAKYYFNGAGNSSAYLKAA